MDYPDGWIKYEEEFDDPVLCWEYRDSLLDRYGENIRNVQLNYIIKPKESEL